MENASKPSGEKGIASFNALFTTSRVTLTLAYTSLACILLFLSGGITNSLLRLRLDTRFIRPTTNEALPLPPSEENLRAFREDIHFVILLVNITLLIFAGGLSYVIAGITFSPIEQAYEKQRDFVRNAAHELKTPLTILRLQIENAQSSEDPQRTSPLKKSLEEIDRMRNLIAHLLHLASLDDHFAQDDIKTSLFSVITTTRERLLPLAKEHGVTLAEITFPQELISFEVPQTTLSHILTNIIHNGISYTPEGGRVTCLVTHDDTWVMVRIEDTGVGISQEDIPRIGERFFRVEKSRNRSRGGSGLGVAFAKEALERLGGRLSIESTQGKGTTVTLKIPRIC